MNMIRILFLVVLMIGCNSSDETARSTVDNGESDLLQTPMSWPTFDEAISTASQTGQPILIDIYAPWCGWCRKMQQEVYTNRDLVKYVQDHFAYGRLNIDDSTTYHTFQGYTMTSQELGYGLGAEGTPTSVFLTSDGTYIAKCPGYWGKEDFSIALRYVATGAWQDISYEEFAQL